MNEAPVTQSELETPRTAAALLPWVLSTIARFNTPELKQAFRGGGDLLAQALRDELLPIALFADKYFARSEHVVVTYTYGDQPYDALVDDRRESPAPVRFIEVTVADHDYEMSLRMEMLSRDGNVPMTGPVFVKGARGKRAELRAELEAVDHDKLVSDHFDRVVAAVNRKAKKKYPQGTALVVRVDDAGTFRLDEDRDDLRELLELRLAPGLRGREFCVLAVVGSAGLYLSSDT